MASFLKQLDLLLRDATSESVIDANSAQALREWAHGRARGDGASRLAGVLGFLGGGAVIIGMILMIAANWDAIPDLAKLGGFVVLFTGVHGLGFWLRATNKPVAKTIESLHFLGGGLFLAGVALVAQIYHLDARPPNGYLLWLISLVPLAITLESAPLTLLTIFAFFLWAHAEGSFAGSPLEMARVASHGLFETAMGVALIGFAPLAQRRQPPVAHVMRGCGVFLLFSNLYVLGFFRYFVDSERRPAVMATMPVAAIVLAVLGLLLGGRFLLCDAPPFRARLLLLLGALLALVVLALAAEFDRLGPGSSVTLFDFGSTRSFPLRDWLITVGAWVLWFLLGFWCVTFGAHTGRTTYLNVGVLAIGLGIVTRSIDLIGSLAQTGGVILLGGIVLLVTGYFLERWRRHLVRRIGAGA